MKALNDWQNVVNGVVALLAVAALFLPGGEFANFFSPEVVKYIALGVAIANILLKQFGGDLRVLK